MHAIALPPNCRHLLVRPWVDPLVDQLGHDTRGPYTERFWLSVLGPSSCWFLRYVAERFETAPDGFDLDLAACAAALGLGGGVDGRATAFPRTLTRCCQFRAARLVNGVTLEVRRKLPPLTARQVERLPESLRMEHSRWVETTDGRTASHPTALAEQARRLALSLVELGEGPLRIEQQLTRWRFPTEMARQATIWAFDRRGAVAVSNLVQGE